MNYTIEELKEAIVRHGDVEFFLDVLNISMEDLVESLEFKIIESYDDLMDEYGLEEEEDEL
jgi:hypothetical protein